MVQWFIGTAFKLRNKKDTVLCVHSLRNLEIRHYTFMVKQDDKELNRNLKRIFRKIADQLFCGVIVAVEDVVAKFPNLFLERQDSVGTF